MLGHCELDNVDFVRPWVVNGHTLPGAACYSWRNSYRVWRGSIEDFRRLPLYVGRSDIHGGYWQRLGAADVQENRVTDVYVWGGKYGKMTARARSELVRDDAAMELVGSIVSEIESGLESAPESISAVREWRDDWSGELDAGRYFDGADSAFRVTRRRHVPRCGKVLRVTFAIGGSWDLSAHAIACSGAGGVALASVLERAGYRVELAAVRYTRCSYVRGGPARDSLGEVHCKSAHDPIDVASLASVFASESLRMMYLASVGLLGAVDFGECAGGLGGSDDAPEFMRGDCHIGLAHSVRESITECKRALAQLAEKNDVAEVFAA